MHNKIRLNFIYFVIFAGGLLIGVGIISLLIMSKSIHEAETSSLQNVPNTTIDSTPSVPDTLIPSGGGSGMSPPATMDEWIKGADIIVQAQVVRVVRSGYSLGYDPQTGTQLYWDNKPTVASVAGGSTPIPSPAYPVTDFEIKPETVFRDDGQIAAGKPLIFSILGHLNSTDTDQTAMPQIGHKYLFVLRQSPDKQTYSKHRECSMLVVSATSLECPGKGQTLLSFMQGQSPAQFITQLKAKTTP